MTTDATSTGGPTTATPSRQRARRSHAATGGRILAGGVSAAAALGLMGAMAHATSPSGDLSTTTADAAPTIIVLRRPEGAIAAAPDAPRFAATVAAPITTSGAS